MNSPTVATPVRGTRTLWRPFLWRGAAFVIVFTLAVVALSSGVGTTERDLSATGLLERAYYALGLFVLGGLDIGTPVGGPVPARIALWLSYFFAPVITASALLEAAIRLIGPLALRLRPLSGHIVVAGAGRASLLYIRKLRAVDRRRTVVVVERDAARPLLAELRDMHRVVVVSGDISSTAVLRGLRLEHAHRVMLLAHDFANLDAASKILSMVPRLAGRIVVHVSDLRFMREVAGSSVATSTQIFNSHEAAASKLVDEQLIDRFHSTPHEDLVVLAGFGRFGQTVLHQLQQRALGSFGHVVVIDENASANTRAFEEEPGFEDGYRRTVLDGDLRDPELWRTIASIVEEEGHDPVIIVGSGTDATNVHAALALQRQHPGAYVVSRSFRPSPFTDEIASDSGIRPYNLSELIEAAMPPHWF